MNPSRIVCSAQGSGPALVLVHGITESRRTWDPLMHDLASDHFVVSVDLRGHGESTTDGPYDPVSLASDVHTVVHELANKAPGLENPILIGHSLGGVVVSAYAAVFGGCGVINIDQSLQLAGFKAQLSAAEPMLRGDVAGFNEFIAAMFATMDGPLPAAERTRISNASHARQEVVLGIWGSILESSVAELDATVDALAAGINVPYLALHGIDPGPVYASWLAARIPTSTVEVWPDHGHYPHLVDPSRFTQRVRAFEAALDATKA
jgi:pimeloyl-ACP methyl ester carboxylesterase